MRYTQLFTLLVLSVLAQRGAIADTDQVPQKRVDTTPATVPAGNLPMTTMPGVNVQRSTDPLSRADRRLARTKRSLPGTNTPPTKDASAKARDYLATHSDPNSASGQQRKMMEGANSAPPEALPGSGLPSSP